MKCVDEMLYDYQQQWERYGNGKECKPSTSVYLEQGAEEIHMYYDTTDVVAERYYQGLSKNIVVTKKQKTSLPLSDKTLLKIVQGNYE